MYLFNRLHGDFLDKNLLLGTKGFLAIDPMPWVGDPCSDMPES